jgi:hypothetical protein
MEKVIKRFAALILLQIIAIAFNPGIAAAPAIDMQSKFSTANELYSNGQYETMNNILDSIWSAKNIPKKLKLDAYRLKTLALLNNKEFDSAVAIVDLMLSVDPTYKADTLADYRHYQLLVKQEKEKLPENILLLDNLNSGDTISGDENSQKIAHEILEHTMHDLKQYSHLCIIDRPPVDKAKYYSLTGVFKRSDTSVSIDLKVRAVGTEPYFGIVLNQHFEAEKPKYIEDSIQYHITDYFGCANEYKWKRYIAGRWKYALIPGSGVFLEADGPKLNWSNVFPTVLLILCQSVILVPIISLERNAYRAYDISKVYGGFARMDFRDDFFIRYKKYLTYARVLEGAFISSWLANEILFAFRNKYATDLKISISPSYIGYCSFSINFPLKTRSLNEQPSGK